ncbi:hypothetical protein Tco_0561414 [Tanacetum coccineum]
MRSVEIVNTLDDGTPKGTAQVDVKDESNSEGTTNKDLEVRKLFDSTPNRFISSSIIGQTSDLDEITLDEITGKLKAFEERIKLRKGEHSGKGRRFRKAKRTYYSHKANTREKEGDLVNA